MSEFLTNLSNQPVVEACGWALLHSLWLFTLVALCLWFVQRLSRRSSSSVRYLTACAALFAMPMMLVATAFMVEPVEPNTSDVGNGVSMPNVVQTEANQLPPPMETAEIVTTDIAPTSATNSVPELTPSVVAPTAITLEGLPAAVRPWLPTIVACWLVGIVLLSMRPLVGWLSVRRLRTKGTSPVSVATANLLKDAADRLGLRRSVRILQSTLVETPAVIGFFKPLVLLPATAITGLPEDQLRALLAHEIAHIRRNDYLVNVLQTTVETLFFYHPAMWWISRTIRNERENCCDDVALSVCEDRTLYASALLAMDRLRPAQPSLAMSAKGGSLLARIRRLTEPTPPDRAWSNWWAAGLLTLSVVLTLAFLLPASSSALAKMDEIDTEEAEVEWGEPINGLRMRIAPVHADMDETKVDLTAVQRKFDSQRDVAFAIEVENVSDKSISLLDTGYGSSFGESSGKPNTDWYGQWLFTIEYFDADGKKLDYPHVEHVMPDLVVASTKVSEINAGATHRFLIRPERWRSIHYQRLLHRKYSAVVHYHGMSESAMKRIKNRKDPGKVLGAWSGNVASARTSFQIARRKLPRTQLDWGDADNGLRATMTIAQDLPWYGHGQKVDLLLHLQNVGDKPISFCSQMWENELGLTIKDNKGEVVKQLPSVTYSGVTPICRTTIQPQQTIIVNAGNLAIAKTEQQAGSFEHITNRKIIVPTGEYRLSLKYDSARAPRMQDGKGNRLAPLDGDWVGSVTSGRKYLFLKDKPFDMKAKQRDNASTPRQWAEVYVDALRDQQNADNTYPASVFDPLRPILKEYVADINKNPNHLLEPGMEVWEAEIDAKNSWTHGELSAHVLELSQWAHYIVSQAHYLRVEASKYPRDVPRPGRKPQSGELDRLKFGPTADDGLRVAWDFAVTGTTHIGEAIDGRMVFHNSGSKPVTFSVEPWGWTDWTVKNQHGNPTGVRSVPIAFWQSTWVRYRLQPGEVADIIGEPLGFGKLNQVDHSLATRWVESRPSDVLTVSGSVRLGKMKIDRKPVEGDHNGHLKFGEHSFSTMGTLGVSTANVDEAGIWAGYFVEQLNYRRNKDGTFPSAAFDSLKRQLAAYEVNGKRVDDWIARADSKDAWPRDEFTAHVKDIAPWRISTVHLAHAEDQKAVMNIAQPGRKPVGNELKKIPFGPAASNGLRMAWVFKPKLGTPLGTHRVGEVLNSKVVFHNSGKEAVTFSSFQWPDASWELRDSDGKVIDVRRVLTSSLNFDWQRCHLPPGWIIEMDAQPIGLGRYRGDGPIPAFIWFPAKASQTFKVSGTFSLGAAQPVGRAAFEEDWRQPLTLKGQTITLVAGGPLPKVAAPASEKGDDKSADDNKGKNKEDANEKGTGESDATKPEGDSAVEPITTGVVVSDRGKPVVGADVLVYQGIFLQDERFTTDADGRFQLPESWRVSSSKTLVAQNDKGHVGWFHFTTHKYSRDGQKPGDKPFEITLLPLEEKIAGLIVNEKNEPVPDAIVLLALVSHKRNLMGTHFAQRKLDGKRLIPGAPSNKKGGFVFVMPRASTGSLRVEHPDYASQHIHLGLHLKDPQPIVLKPASKIHGVITDSRTGNPVVGVRMVASANTDPRIGREHGGWTEAVTDKDGRYEIGGLMEGSWAVKMLECTDPKLSAPAVSAIELAKGESKEINVSLQPGHRVFGTLTDATSGKRVPDWPMHCSSSRGELDYANTNTNGEFEFYVPAGKVRVYVAGDRIKTKLSDMNIVVEKGKPSQLLAMTAKPATKRSEDEGVRHFSLVPLERLVSLTAKRMPMHEALKNVCGEAGMLLDLDTNGLKREGYTRNMLVNLKLHDIKLRNALDQITKPFAKMAWTISQDLDAPPGGRIFVSSTDNVKKREADALTSLQKRKLSEVVLTAIITSDDESQEVWLRQRFDQHNIIVKPNGDITVGDLKLKLKSVSTRWAEWEVDGQTKRQNLGDSLDKLENPPGV